MMNNKKTIPNRTPNKGMDSLLSPGSSRKAVRNTSQMLSSASAARPADRSGLDPGQWLIAKAIGR